MRLYGALSELASLVIRLASGKTVTISSAEQNVDKTISIPALPDAVNSDEIVLKEAQQTLRRKTLEGVVTSGVSSVKLQSADVTSTNALEVPNGNPSISTGLRRLSSTGNLLYLGTGTAFKEMVDKDSSQLLKNKTIPAGGGVDENVITGLNPASPDVFLTVGGHADKVVKYNNSGVAQVAKIVNANVDDAAGISGTKLGDNSVTVAKLASMTSADLAGKITDETGSGALVFANNPTIGSMTAASGVLSIAGTGALKIPAGLQSERPASPVEGMIRYNSETDSFEGYASNTWSGIGGGGTVDRITQIGHGFVVGDALWLNGLTYTKAKADAANTAEVVGMVSRFIDVDNFEMTLSGEVSGLSGLTPGEVYFLSASTAGALTVTEPSVVGHVSLPVGVASSTTSLYVAPKRGVVVGGANLRTQIGLNGAALVSQTTNIQNVKDYDAGELSGWVYIDATTDRRFYIQVQFVKNAAGAWNCAYQTTGDTPPAGFNVDVIVSGSDAFVQVQMPAVAGWVSGSVNFALNAPAVGTSLPLQVSSTSVNFTDIKASSSAGITFKEDGGATVGSVSDAGAWSFGPASGNTSAHIIRSSPNSSSTPILTVSDTGAATLTHIAFTSSGTNRGGISADSLNSFIVNASDLTSTLGKCSATGAWTLGPTSGVVSHTLRTNGSSVGSLFTAGASGITPMLSTFQGTNAIAINAGSGGTGIFSNSSITFTTATYADLTSSTYNGTGTERMRIDASGTVSVGPAATGYGGLNVTKTGSLSPGVFLWINATATNQKFASFEYNGNGGSGSITPNGTGNVAFNTGPSDYRLKDEVVELSGGLEKIKSLRPVSFRWKKSGETDVGFIAHEIQRVIPQCVNGDKDATDEEGNPSYQSIFPAPAQMIANLVAAIQEQQEQIEALKAEIQLLKNK